MCNILSPMLCNIILNLAQGLFFFLKTKQQKQQTQIPQVNNTPFLSPTLPTPPKKQNQNPNSPKPASAQMSFVLQPILSCGSPFQPHFSSRSRLTFSLKLKPNPALRVSPTKALLGFVQLLSMLRAIWLSFYETFKLTGHLNSE